MREVEYKSRGHVDLLKFYNDQWLHYQFSAKVLDGICRYLNRSFKKQAQEATSSFYEIKTDDVFVVYNLALSIWRDLFFSKFHSTLEFFKLVKHFFDFFKKKIFTQF